jgi:hypothetical protein
MGERKHIGISTAVLAALLAIPSLSPAQGGPVRLNESFVLGDTGCQMNLALEGDQVVSANLGPAFEPPPEPFTVYSFNFTGSVAEITAISWGPPLPIPVSIGDIFNGTLTYDPTTFTRDVLSNVVQYLPNPATIGNIKFSFGSGQSFESIYFPYNYALVYNNTPNDSFSINAYIWPDPPISGLDNNNLVDFILADSSGTALSSFDFPTNLNFGDWTERIFQFILRAGDSQLAVSGALSSLAPVSVPSPSPSPMPPPGAAVCTGELPIVEQITQTLICKDCTENPDGSFACSPENCERKKYVERNIMEKSGDGSTYCYYTKTGQRVCKTF